MNTTRFNPTPNGALHLGHVYNILFNEQFAHNNGGKFYVRFEDTCQALITENIPPEHIKPIMQLQRNDIEWLGIDVDVWDTQAIWKDEADKKISQYIKLDKLRIPYPHNMPVSIGTVDEFYPYTPYHTAFRVVLDNMIGITHVIRGNEFLTEYSLYYFFCDLFGYDVPHFLYIPRLVSSSGDISKSHGGYSIAELRASGYNPKEIRKLLRESCLKWPNNGWTFQNLKVNPRVNL